MSPLWTAAFVSLWIIVAVLAFMVVGLLRQLGLIQLRLGADAGALLTEEGLERGTVAPDFEAPDANSGSMLRLGDFRGRRVALVFLTTGCLACRELIPHLNKVSRDEGSRVEFLTVCFGTVPGCREFSTRFRVGPKVLIDPRNEIATKYGISATPSAFLIDESGIILVRGIVNTWPHLEALLREEGTPQHGSSPWLSATVGIGNGQGGPHREIAVDELLPVQD